MRILKGSILSRSSHGAKGFEAQRRESIEKWLKEYDIENYTINDDFTIDVNGNVNLFGRNLKELPDYIQFGVVRGIFVCTDNNLTSLRGAPREVGQGFYCDINKLTSLRGAPKEVGGYFGCDDNVLTSLEGAPKKVSGDFYCDHNQLTSLEGAPEKVGGDFYCHNNNLTSLEGAPKEIGRDFDCSKNTIKFTEENVRKICNVKGTIYIK